MTWRNSFSACLFVTSLSLVFVSVATRPSFAQKKAEKASPAKSSVQQLGVKDGEKQPAVPRRSITIAKVDPATLATVKASAKQIDRLMQASYDKFKVTPNPMASDETWVRRVYLDVTGTIPNARQVQTFVSSRSADKRTVLIDQLLNSKGYVSHTYNYWADVFRLKDRLAGNNLYSFPYDEWIKVCLEKNVAYDQWVYEMLTATGRIFDNPATGYFLRDEGMPLDAVNNTVRVFMGTQIGCAQCHNHPFDRWTQKEFYQMAAFTYSTKTKIGANDKQVFGGQNVHSRLKKELEELDKDNRNLITKYRDFTQANLYNVVDRKTQLVLPHDYQYDDGKPKDKVEPVSIFTNTKPGPNDTYRTVFAKWMTSPDNPRFTKTIANRIWKRLFGVGQIEPEDDMRDDTVPENPELMAYLESEMKRVKFDTKEFMRILLNTEAYSREATAEELDLAAVYRFPGPVLRRMTAEQIWDSFCTLAVHNPDDYQPMPSKFYTELAACDLATITGAEIIEREKKLNELRRDDKKDRDKPYSYKGQLLVRASELPKPLPPNHFLRQFGLSDRETIQGNFEDGTVPQVLQMFNGPVTHMLLEPGGLMYETVTKVVNQNSRMDVIFQSILSRKPTKEEEAAAAKEIKDKGNAGYGNVIWALTNTREFFFIQ